MRRTRRILVPTTAAALGRATMSGTAAMAAASIVASLTLAGPVFAARQTAASAPPHAATVPASSHPAAPRLAAARVAAPRLANPRLAAPNPAVGSNAWVQDGYGPGNSGFNAAETEITPANVATLAYRWSIVSPVERGACEHQAPPIVGDGRLFLRDQGGFAAYRVQDGHRLWTKRFGDPADEAVTQIALRGSTLLAATVDCQSQSDPNGNLDAYDAATGHRLWDVARDAPFYEMVEDAGIVVAAGGDAAADEVSAYRLSDGHRLWSRFGVELAADASANGRLLLSRTDGTGAVAVRLTTGAKIWQTADRWSVLAANPAGTTFFVTNPAGDLVAVNAATGVRAWTAAGLGGHIAVDNTRVYVGSNDDLLALAATTGVRQWDQNLGSGVGRPVVAAGVVYATEDGGDLTVRDAATGDDLDPDNPYDGEIGHAVIVGSRLFVTDGRVLDMYSH